MQHSNIYQETKHEAFVYVWINLTLDKQYIGYHKGSQDDGYIASSSSEEFWKDFENESMKWKRDIIFEGTRSECLREEQCMLREADFSTGKYYNMARGAEVIFTDEVREKIRQYHLGKPSGMLGKKHSEETKKYLSKILKGREFTGIHKQNLSEAGKGREFTETHKQNLSKALKGRKVIFQKYECPHCHKWNNPVISKRWHFDSCKQNPKNSILKHKIKLAKCPFCHKTGNIIAMGRWHFDNCKLKNQEAIQSETS